MELSTGSTRSGPPTPIGLYLGDGYIASHLRGVFKMRLFLDDRYPEILADAEAVMAVVVPASKVNHLPRVGDVEIYSYSKSWPCLFPQHGLGKKHERPIVLEPWQEHLVATWPKFLLRGLIHSDGCRFINTGRKWTYPRYAFDNRSADIRRIFCGTCDLLGLRWTESRNTVYVSRKADVDRMDEFIGSKA